MDLTFSKNKIKDYKMFEFLSYLPTPNDKSLGIVTIKAYGKIILRYKVVAGKEGHGFFLSPSSYKVGTDAMGKDIYEKCFMIDSIYENKLLEDLVRANVNPYAHNSALNGPSSFNNASLHAGIAPNVNGSMQGHYNANSNSRPVFGQNQQVEVGNYFEKGDNIPF
jgi:hypothetical protein